MDFNDVLRGEGIEPETVIVLRHSFSDVKKHRTLLRVASEDIELFDAFQSVQGARVERAMEVLSGRGFVAAFIGNVPGKALFVGLFRIVDSIVMRPDDTYALLPYQKLHEIGLMTREEFKNDFHRRFSMNPVESFASLKGRLLVEWPGLERAWYRKAASNVIRVLAIHEKSTMDLPMPDWRDLCSTWDELATLPRSWRDALAQWRGIYYIRDMSDGRGYVGSASGIHNLLGRWSDYRATGYGGNKFLRRRNPMNFRFSILERLSPDADKDVVMQSETSWKVRLCTRNPNGLNDN